MGLNGATLAPERAQVERVVGLFRNAGDPTRLAVLQLLAGGDHNVTAIQSALGLASQPALSHHLALLRLGGLIQYRRNGKTNVYSLTEDGEAIVKFTGSLATL